VQVFRREASVFRAGDLPLQGLCREARYLVTDLDAPDTPGEYTGETLLDTGLPVEIRSRPGAALYHYRRVSQ